MTFKPCPNVIICTCFWLQTLNDPKDQLRQFITSGFPKRFFLDISIILFCTYLKPAPWTGRSKSASKYRGIRWHQRNCQWEACIFKGAKQARFQFKDPTYLYYSNRLHRGSTAETLIAGQMALVTGPLGLPTLYCWFERPET